MLHIFRKNLMYFHSLIHYFQLNFSVITCNEPDAPPGGFVVGYDLNVHSSIEYHCEIGHKLVGENTFTCNSNGEWSGEPPICECKYFYYL